MGITKETILVELRTRMAGFKEGMSQATESAGELRKNLKTTTGVGKKLGMAFGTIAKQMQGFRMELLGMMFGGMMIMRTFQNILRSGMETFMKITQGATQASAAMIGLSAEFAYLKFTVGRAISEALLPLMPYIISIIRSVSSWVKANPKLTATITLLGIALGGLLFIFGSIGLLLNALTIFFTEGIGAAIIAFINTALAWLGISLGVALGIIAALIVLIISVWQIVVNWGKDWVKVFKWIGIAALALGVILFLVFGGWIILAIALAVAALAWLTAWIIKNWEAIKTVTMAALKAIGDWFKKWFWEEPKKWFQKFIDWIVKKWETIKGFVSKITGVGGGEVKGSRQFGGMIPETGMYQMHRGEKIVPAGNNNSFGGITINVNSSGGQVDVRKIADQLMSEIKRRTA